MNLLQIISIGIITFATSAIGNDDNIVFPGQYHKPKPGIRNRNKNLGNTTTDSQIPSNIARILAETNDVDDFVERYVSNKEQLYSDLRAKNPDTVIASRFGGGGTKKVASNSLPPLAKCIPQPTVISVLPENLDPSVVHVPSCTRVNRCSGCCSDEYDCVPKETVMKTFNIIELSFNKKRNQVQYKRTIEVQREEHVTCECGCTTRKEDCSPGSEYLAAECRCECGRNPYEAQHFREECVSRRGRRWKPETCSCACERNNNCENN